MAKVTSYTDDIDGSPGASERTFSVGGSNYVIDLTDENYLKHILKPLEFVRSRARAERKGKYKLSDEQRAEVRKYAQSVGRPIAVRGRYPDAIIQEYFDQLDQDDERPA